jgi:ubiquinol-cytochrome c reductase cytochrome c1 subunit
MKAAMKEIDASEAFGKAPPDLSVVARSRGADWIYTYLRSFYLDPSRPLGVNNVVFPNVGMPHVLWQLQGWQEKKESDEHGGHGAAELSMVSPGSVPPVQYDQIVRDITNFLTYMAEPARDSRQKIGIFVMLFLFVFFVSAYFLKKEYWKDVH